VSNIQHMVISWGFKNEMRDFLIKLGVITPGTFDGDALVVSFE